MGHIKWAAFMTFNLKRWFATKILRLPESLSIQKYDLKYFYHL
jgi:hypothetical protein